MHLAKVRQPRLLPSKISMSNVRSSMGVPFNAVTFDKHYVTLRALAEIVPVIGGNRHDGAFERWNRFQSHVARVNDRCRLRRRYSASSESDIRRAAGCLSSHEPESPKVSLPDGHVRAPRRLVRHFGGQGPTSPSGRRYSETDTPTQAQRRATPKARRGPSRARKVGDPSDCKRLTMASSCPFPTYNLSILRKRSGETTMPSKLNRST
jgi:hypothetical protein